MQFCHHVARSLLGSSRCIKSVKIRLDEGREGVKWELGFALFYWENGINSTGTGILSLGMGFEK